MFFKIQGQEEYECEISESFFTPNGETASSTLGRLILPFLWTPTSPNNWVYRVTFYVLIRYLYSSFLSFVKVSGIQSLFFNHLKLQLSTLISL